MKQIQNQLRKLALLGTMAFVLLLVPQTSIAHTKGTTTGDAAHAVLVEPDIFTAGTLLPIWIEVSDTQTNTLISNLAITIEVMRDGETNPIFTGEALVQGTRYLVEYEFPKGGNYQIHSSFEYRNEQHKIDFAIAVNEPVDSTDSTVSGSILWGGIGLAIIVLGIGAVRHRLKSALIAAAIITLLSVLGWALTITFQSGGPSVGLITCPSEDSCFWVAHIHAFAPVEICGNDYRFPIEVGPLSDAHTHEEKNVIHWHDRLPFNPATETVTDAQPLTLSAFFDVIGVYFDADGIAEWRNGDTCPDGSVGSLKVFVNGLQNNEFGSYLWRDHDVIIVRFDDAAPEVIEAELRTNPITFPSLGRG